MTLFDVDFQWKNFLAIFFLIPNFQMQTYVWGKVFSNQMGLFILDLHQMDVSFFSVMDWARIANGCVVFLS